MFQPLSRRQRLGHKTSAWASGGSAWGWRLAACLGRRDDAVAAREEQLGRCTAELIVLAVNRHKREVNDFACGKTSRRGPPAAFPGADV